ncbi:MAG: amidase [Gammaproteobacteria bacterium]
MNETARDADVEALMRRAQLTLTDEERQWVDNAFNGYRAQLEALHALDLDGEAVGAGYTVTAGPTGDSGPRVTTLPSSSRGEAAPSADGSGDLHYLSIADAATLIERGELSPTELTQAYLKRIAGVDERLHAYITLLADSAMEQARTAEREIRDGHYRGALHGIPVALKDLFDTAGVATTGASKAHRARVPAQDCAVAERLEVAGAILLGKLTMSELAMTGPPGFGEEARNPWNTERVPGWSSSGSAVAVAAGLCAGAFGSDTGGSIRFPASYNNIVGLMPSFGRISQRGTMLLSPTLDHFGPMTRTVTDAALMLEATAGFDPRDPNSARAPVPNFAGELARKLTGKRVGVLHQANEGVYPQTLRAVETAIRDLEKLGAGVGDVTIPSFEHAHIANCIIYLTEGTVLHQDVLRTRSGDIGQIFRIYGFLGALFTAADYMQAQRLRTRITRELMEIYGTVDVLVFPATASPARPLADFDPYSLTDAGRSGPSEIFNLAGCPAVSVPCGFTGDGLPIGLQIAGAPLDDASVLGTAFAYEQMNPWYRTHPAL